MGDVVLTNWFGDVGSGPCRAYADDSFARARQARDPDGRLLNPYFDALLGADQGSTASRPRPARQQAIR